MVRNGRFICAGTSHGRHTAAVTGSAPPQRLQRFSPALRKVSRKGGSAVVERALGGADEDVGLRAVADTEPLRLAGRKLELDDDPGLLSAWFDGRIRAEIGTLALDAGSMRACPDHQPVGAGRCSSTTPLL